MRSRSISLSVFLFPSNRVYTVSTTTEPQCVGPVTRAADRRSGGDNVPLRQFVVATPTPTPPISGHHPPRPVINGLVAAAATLPSSTSPLASEPLCSSVCISGATAGRAADQASNRSSGISVCGTAVAAMLSISSAQQPPQPAAASASVLVVAKTTRPATTCDDKMKSDRTSVCGAAAPSESEMVMKQRVVAGISGSGGGSAAPRISVATVTSVQSKVVPATATAGGRQLVAASDDGPAVADGVKCVALAAHDSVRGSRLDKPSADGGEQLERRLQIAEPEVFDADDDEDPYAELEYYLENVKVSEGTYILFNNYYLLIKYQLIEKVNAYPRK